LKTSRKEQNELEPTKCFQIKKYASINFEDGVLKVLKNYQPLLGSSLCGRGRLSGLRGLRDSVLRRDGEGQAQDQEHKTRHVEGMRAEERRLVALIGIASFEEGIHTHTQHSTQYASTHSTISPPCVVRCGLRSRKLVSSPSLLCLRGALGSSTQKTEMTHSLLYFVHTRYAVRTQTVFISVETTKSNSSTCYEII